jgi:hypothetical protein
MDKRPPVLSRRLSGIDAVFLYLERKEIPLNIAAVAHRHAGPARSGARRRGRAAGDRIIEGRLTL